MSDLDKARAHIGQVHKRRWGEMVNDELRRIVDKKPSQEELLDFLSDFRNQIRDIEDDFSLQLFLYWLERRVDRICGLIVVGSEPDR